MHPVFHEGFLFLAGPKCILAGLEGMCASNPTFAGRAGLLVVLGVGLPVERGPRPSGPAGCKEAIPFFLALRRVGFPQSEKKATMGHCCLHCRHRTASHVSPMWLRTSTRRLASTAMSGRAPDRRFPEIVRDACGRAVGFSSVATPGRKRRRAQDA